MKLPNDSSDDVKRLAAQKLGELGNKKAVKPLTKSLNDSALGDKKVISLLINMLLELWES